MNQAKIQLNKDYIKIQNKLNESQSQLQVTRNVTFSISIFFNFIKRSQKLLNLSLFTDEIELI